jgi:hypothetical protein
VKYFAISFDWNSLEWIHHHHHHHHITICKTALFEPLPSSEDAVRFYSDFTSLVLTTIIFLQSKAKSLASNPQPAELYPFTDVPQWQGGPVIPAGTRFPIPRLLRLAELRWGYPNPHPHADVYNIANIIFASMSKLYHSDLSYVKKFRLYMTGIRTCEAWAYTQNLK